MEGVVMALVVVVVVVLVAVIGVTGGCGVVGLRDFLGRTGSMCGGVRGKALLRVPRAVPPGV